MSEKTCGQCRHWNQDQYDCEVVMFLDVSNHVGLSDAAEACPAFAPKDASDGH